MPEVESTFIWNNSAWNPLQYVVENNWVVCLLSCISQSGSPFTLTFILTTPNWNCSDQLLMNTISPGISLLHSRFQCRHATLDDTKNGCVVDYPGIGSSLKLCTFIANQKASVCWRHSKSHAHESVALKPVSTIIAKIVGKTATYFGLFLAVLSGLDINRYYSKSR